MEGAAMINKTLFLKEWKTNWKMLVLFAAILTLYGAMIVSMFDPKLGESLKMMMGKHASDFLRIWHG